MRRPLRLSALDLSPVPVGSTPGEALWRTVDLARHVERLGLTRFWVSEHHNTASLASAAPEVLIATIAATTSSIRVGAGGVMLPNHAPLRVAEVYRALHALHPGRIDLGLGRAAGTDPRAALALRRGAKQASSEGFPEMLDEVTAYLAEDGAPRPPFGGPIVAIPSGVAAPDLWVLGSSVAAAELAAARGMGFAYAHHIDPGDAVASVTRYREAFRPSAWRTEPEAIVSVWVVCAETDAEAEALRTSAELAYLHFGQGHRDAPLPTVEEAARYPYDDDEKKLCEAHRGRFFALSRAQVGDRLRALAADAGADELMVVTAVHDAAARKRSYDLVAEALGIVPRG